MSGTMTRLSDVILAVLVGALRAAYVGWWDCEFGAPAIDCKRPYGNSDVYRDIAEILEFPHWDEDEREYSSVEKQTMRRLHEETATALQIVLGTGEMRVGRYTCKPYTREWRLVEEGPTS